MNAIILFSYGTLTSIDDVESFYKHLMRSHATEEVIEQGKKLYKKIGICDPLSTSVKRIGRMLVSRLESDTGEEWRYYIGNKHTFPFVKDAVQACVEDGAERVITVPTSPFHSKTGAELYILQAKRALERYGPDLPLITLTNYYREPAFIHIIAERLIAAYDWLPKNVQEDAEVIFTCHSMPGSTESNRGFMEQYEHLAKELITRMPSQKAYFMAYRSAGPDKDRWLQPDILDVIQERASNGAKALVVCELLSIIANLEVIQEVGMEARELAEHLGIDFVQSEYINDHHDFVDFLATYIKQHLAEKVRQS